MERNSRPLKVTTAGGWYLGLTIVLGVTALVSGNNVLYLLESLLMGALIVFGIFSERSLYSIEISRIQGEVSAGHPAKDRIEITNRSRFPVVCIEVGEFRNGKFQLIGIVPYLRGREVKVLQSTQVLPQRGLHKWDSVGVGTSFPSGFAQKVRLMEDGGYRLVWPANRTLKGEKEQLDSNNDQKISRVRIQQRVPEREEGEVRVMNFDDDYRWVVWTLSAKGKDRYVHKRRSIAILQEVYLDLRMAPGEDFEQDVIEAATPFYKESHGEESSGILILLSQSGRKKITGRRKILDFLATVKPEGKKAV